MLDELMNVSPAWYLCAAGAAVLTTGLVAARKDIARAETTEKVVALGHLCFAVPLAVFGAEHFTSVAAMTRMVPPYMPFRAFWIYFVGVALIAASFSIATRNLVRWSGALFGVMMFLFVAMLYLPSALKTGERFTWTIVFREMSFGAGGLALAGVAMGAKGKPLCSVGRVLIGMTALFFGVQHFLHPLGMPGVPLQKLMPDWVPVRPLIGYLTGGGLVVAAACFLSGRKARLAAIYLGTWIVLLVAVIYVPTMIGALASGIDATRIEGLNYFADTLLFGGVILSLAQRPAE